MRRRTRLNRSDIISTAKINSLNILNLDIIRIISQGQRVNAVAKIKNYVILSNRKTKIIGMTATN